MDSNFGLIILIGIILVAAWKVFSFVKSIVFRFLGIIGVVITIWRLSLFI